MDESLTGISASTDTGGGDVSTSSAGSLTGSGSDSASPMDGAEFVSSFLRGTEQLPTDGPESTDSTPAESPEPIPSAEDGSQEAPAEESPLAIPATDDDLSKLTDLTAKEHIRGLRSHVRGTLEPKAKAFDQFQATLERYGVEETLLEPSVQLMSGLLGSQQRPVLKDGQPQYDQNGQPLMENVPTTYQFWNSLAELSQPHLQQLLDDALAFFPDYFAQRFPQEAAMQSLGVDPQTWADFQRFQQDGGMYGSPSFDSEIANALPEELREDYRRADPDLQSELNLMTPAVRETLLRQQHQLRMIDEQAKQQAAQQQQAQQQALAQAAEQRVADFSTAKNQAFLSDLAKTWNPFGPGKDAENKRIHETIFRDVQAQMYQNPKTVQLIRGLDDALRNNNQLAVTSVWTQLNVELTRMRNEATAFYDALFQSSNAANSQARTASASIKNIAHTGGMPDNRAPDSLPADNSSALRALAGSLGIQLQ